MIEEFEARELNDQLYIFGNFNINLLVKVNKADLTLDDLFDTN